MARTMHRHAWTAAALGALLLASACTMNETSAPDIAGPSELGLSINLAANPDILTMDGYATSEIVVTARNSTGGPANGIGIRAEIVYQGQIQDVGRLSSKTATTGNDGRAVLAYTAPSSSQGLNVDGGNAIVTIRVIPVGSDYAAAVERSVNIRLVPQGITGPRPGTPIAKFRFAPTSPKEGEEIRFDGSLSRDCAPDQSAADCLAQQGPSPTLVRYFWQWGDGDDAEGMLEEHKYNKAGTYTVTLTVTNDRGISASEIQFVTVGVGEQTKADFFVSPSDPLPGQLVIFDARSSTAPDGVSIVAWDWNFGDGTTGSGQQVTHTFTTVGTYTVLLTVTDSRGKKAETTKAVPVKIPVPPSSGD